MVKELGDSASARRTWRALEPVLLLRGLEQQRRLAFIRLWPEGEPDKRRSGQNDLAYS